MQRSSGSYARSVRSGVNEGPPTAYWIEIQVQIFQMLAPVLGIPGSPRGKYSFLRLSHMQCAANSDGAGVVAANDAGLCRVRGIVHHFAICPFVSECGTWTRGDQSNPRFEVTLEVLRNWHGTVVRPTAHRPKACVSNVIPPYHRGPASSRDGQGTPNSRYKE